MKRTPNYGLPIVENNDRYSKEEQNSTMSIIDSELHGMSETLKNIDIEGNAEIIREIVDARNNETTLKNRLDKVDSKINEVSTSLENIMSVDSYKNFRLDTDTNSQAIQKTINNGDKILYIPEGETIIETSLIPVDGLIIEGVGKTNGKNSVLVLNNCNGFENNSDTKVKITIRNLKIKGVNGTETGVKGNIGLVVDNVHFENLDYGINTINSYNTDVIYSTFTGNNIGIKTEIANRVCIEKCSFSNNVNHIITGENSVAYVIKNNVLNQSTKTKCCVIANGGIEISQNYFEGFGVDVRPCFIDYTFSKFGKFYLNIVNNMFETHGMVDSIINARMKIGQTSGYMLGEIRFNTTNGCSTLINIVDNNDFVLPYISDNSINSVVGYNPSKPHKPVFSGKIIEKVVLPTETTTLALDNSKVGYDNFDGLSERDGGVRIKRTGVYKISFCCCISSNVPIRGLKCGVYNNSTEIISQSTSLSVVESGTSYKTLSMEIYANINSGSNIYAKSTGGGSTVRGNLIVEFIE